MKKLVAEKKAQDKESSAKPVTKTQQKKLEELEAQKRLETEVLHQTEEAERRALCKAMMADGAAKRPSLNNSCLKVLNNFQGNFI